MSTFTGFVGKRLRAAAAALVLFSSGPGPAAATDLFVSDYTSGQILRYDADTGAFLGVFASSSQLIGPVTLTFGPDGNLYVAGEISGNVTRFDGQTGAFIDTFIPNGPSGVTSGHGLTFGPDGNLYVSSQFAGHVDVRRFDGLTGAFIDVFVPSGSGGVNPPLDLRFGPDNNLYVASRDTNQVLRYHGVTGAFVGVAASGGGLDAPVAETFGPDGHLYVSSIHTNQVLRYDGTTGAFIDVFASGGGLVQPNNLTFGPDGNLYVAGEGSGIQRYDGTTGAFIDTLVPLGSGGLQRAVGLLFTAPANARPVCDAAQASPSQLWPPNHRLVPVGIGGVTDPDNDTIAIAVTSVRQDEPVNGLGDGDTSPDAFIQGNSVLLRAERAGSRDGRVYYVNFTAHDGHGGQCSGTVTVCVPHDHSGRPCIGDGPLYDSTQP